MSVVSFEFLGFLAALAVVYYVLPMRVRKWALLAGSAAFWLLCGLQGAAYRTAETLLIWGCARLMGRFSERRGVCRALLVGAMVLMKALAQLQALPDGLLVPIGLSYFTFQSVGYLIDVYRGKITPEKNYAKVLLFAGFFPQMTQGPITTWKQLMPQLDSPHRLSPNGFVSGVFLMAWGFFKKLVIADRLMPVVSVLVAAAQELPGWLVLATAAMYAIVLYADFSGGIDIIRGAAELLGIDLPENFRRPFFAASIADYWRRWHISLGAWMRDYVFYPFALTRPVSRMSKALKKKAGTHIARALPAALGNILVFLLVGVWHGAQMNYVLWGLYNGVILAFTALVEPVYKRMNDRLPRLTASGGFHVFRILRTFLVVNIGWYFDRCVRVCDAFAMLHKTFFAFNAQQLFDGTLDTLGLAAKDYRILLVATILLFVVSLMQERGVKIRDFVLSRPLALRWAVLSAFIFFVLATFGGSNVAASGFMYAVF